MKKFLFSVLLCMNIACAMEQPLNLYCVMQTWKENNPIACQLDGKSFSASTCVCKRFQRICNAIAPEYLAFDFGDVAEHGNKNLIDRFINQPDGWIFEEGMGKEVPWENSTDETVKIFKRVFNCGVQKFLGDYSLYGIKQTDKLVRCIATWRSDEIYNNKPKLVHSLSINLDRCDDVVNLASQKCMNSKNRYLYNSEGGLSFFYSDEGSKGSYHYKILDLLESMEVFIQKFGMLILLISAAQKNNATVLVSILNSFKIPDSLLINTVMSDKRPPLRPIAISLGSEHPYGCIGWGNPDFVKKAIYQLVMQNLEL